MTGRHRIHPTNTVLAAAAALLLCSPVLAQDEAELKKAFEGKRVILKIDMPATSSGVDVWPDRDLAVDFSEVAKLIKGNGTAIRAGEDEMVTKVHVARKHIEFQLGGGGYGTFSDMLSSPHQAPPIYQGETPRKSATSRRRSLPPTTRARSGTSNFGSATSSASGRLTTPLPKDRWRR